jgi:hypothetical protein
MPADSRYWRALTFGGWVFLATLAALAMWRLQPPALVRGPIAADAFSVARASAHLQAVASEPHPTGSPAAGRVRDYIAGYLTAQGLRVELQAQPACTLLAGLRQCAHVQNVIATLPGRDPRSAVLLSAHYDTVPNAPGAADDGAGVAALLETARALAHGPRLAHDVVFALVDGEEELLLGSAAFVGSSATFAKVRLAANFEARGSRGASALVGLSKNSAAIATQFAAKTPHPVVNSFYCTVAAMLPNGTDAEMYGLSGVKTLSFAFADGLENYHQGTDSLANLDLRSLQHHGQHALAFAKHFADSNLEEVDRLDGDRVFFDLLGVVVVSYPYWAARLFSLVSVLLVAALCVDARRRAALTGKHLVLAALSFLGLVLAIGGVLAALGAFITYGWPLWAAAAHRALLTSYLAGAGAALFLYGSRWQARRFGTRATVLGPLVIWACMATTAAVFAPATTHLFVWPLFGAGLAERLRAHRFASARLIWLAPAVVAGCQLSYTLLVLLGGKAPFVPVVSLLFFAGLFLGVLESSLPQFPATSRALRAAFMLGALALVLLGRFTPAPPPGSSVAYAVDSGGRRAFWLSSDARLSEYTKQFFGADARRGRREPFASSTPLFESAAPFRDLPAPLLEPLDHAATQGKRKITLRIRSPRGARAILVWEASGAKFSRFRFDGREVVAVTRFSQELDTKLFRLVTGVGYEAAWTVLLLAVPSAGSTLELETDDPRTLTFYALDKSQGLESLPERAGPRPPSETTGPPGDQTWVMGPALKIPPAELDFLR